MSITKERRDAIREALQPRRGMLSEQRSGIIALLDALDAADREALSSMEEITRLREELEAAEAMAEAAADIVECMDDAGLSGANLDLVPLRNALRQFKLEAPATDAAEAKMGEPDAWQYRDKRLAVPEWRHVPDADFREAIGMHPKIYEVRPLYADPKIASMELAKSALQNYPIGRVLPLSTEGAPPAAEPVKVRPLEWLRDYVDRVWYGNAPSQWIGLGYIVKGNGSWCVRGTGRWIFDGAYDLGGAKAAAQADYERRIRSALILPAPSS